MAHLRLVRRYTAVPPDNAQPNEQHPFFKNATEWRLSWLANRVDQTAWSPIILDSRQCEMGATKFGPAILGTETASLSGVRIASAILERHIALWGAPYGYEVSNQVSGTGRNYYGLISLSSAAALAFGNGGAPGPTARRSYDLSRSGDFYVVRPDASISTAPAVWTDGATNTATYSSGTASSYNWGTAGLAYQVGYSAGLNANVRNALPFYAATNDLTIDDAILADLSRDPWQLWRPRKIYAPFTTATGGLPTLSLPTAVPGSITSNGWRPRFTATY